MICLILENQFPEEEKNEDFHGSQILTFKKVTFCVSKLTFDFLASFMCIQTSSKEIVIKVR